METTYQTALLDWNLWGKYSINLKGRKKYTLKLQEYLQSSKLVVLMGVRRAGKSSLVLSFLEQQIKTGYIKPVQTLLLNFEDPRLRRLTPEGILSLIEEAKLTFDIDPLYILLDEIQHITGWESAVRTLYDTKPYKLIVTGSNTNILSGTSITSLSGRYLALYVYPLDFWEFLEFNGCTPASKPEFYKQLPQIRKLLQDYMEFGGFPDVVLSQNKKERLLVYYETILLKDVAERASVKSTHPLLDFSTFLLTNIGRPVTMYSMAKQFSLSVDSIRRYLDLFEQSYLFYFVHKFDYSLKKQMVNPKKVYAIDTGLRNMVGFTFSQDLGWLMENIVFLELMRREYEIFYWKNEREVDFVVKKGKTTELLNVTAAEQEIDGREIEGILHAMDALKLVESTIITYNLEKNIRKDKKQITMIPIYKWLLGI